MSKNLIFKNLKNENIFSREFQDSTENNIINFDKNISVFYAPNGTGKTSLTRCLSGPFNNNISFEVIYNNNTYKNDSNLFYIISDQTSRNIIEGEAGDFVLGDDIRHEAELQNKINEEFQSICNTINEKMKNDFKISKMSYNKKEYIKDEIMLSKYIEDIANNKNKGKTIDTISSIKIFIDDIKKLYEENDIEIGEDFEREEFNFIMENLEKNDSLVKSLINLNIEVEYELSLIADINEKKDAISILEKYIEKDECIVCDSTDYNAEALKVRKNEEQNRVIEALDENTRKMIDTIIEKANNLDVDPLNIKGILNEVLLDDNINCICILKEKISKYIIYFKIELLKLFYNSISSRIVDLIEEYDEYLENELVFTDEDETLIQNIISENIGKDIIIKRADENRGKIKLELSGDEFLNVDRTQLKLSNGEQNFISLTFEFLKAKNLNSSKIIVIDDPISSFDSIYKNKLAFCILKLLNGKKTIILTHNLDVVRLLQHQHNNCFNLYIFNNKCSEMNGFIPVSNKDLELLLEVPKLTKFMRCDFKNEVENKKNYIISLLPFMRSYANLIGDTDCYQQLSKVMHGYENEEINISNIYNSLFGRAISLIDTDYIVKATSLIDTDYIVKAEDIIDINLQDNNGCILKEDTEYRLLASALEHTFKYLQLRLNTESVLYPYIHNNGNGIIKLGDIIKKVFEKKPEKRIFFNSKKTLLNEFNHCEGNMNIFQPAIDITDDSLEKEISAIKIKLENIRENGI